MKVLWSAAVLRRFRVVVRKSCWLSEVPKLFEIKVTNPDNQPKQFSTIKIETDARTRRTERIAKLQGIGVRRHLHPLSLAAVLHTAMQAGVSSVVKIPAF